MSKRPRKRRQQNQSTPFSFKHFLVALVGALGLVLLGVLMLSGGDDVPEDFEPQVEGDPRLAVISEGVIDHGDVVVNNMVESVFRVQNVGSETLHILDEPYVELVRGC